MSQIDGTFFFAPGIPFSVVDTETEEIVDQFRKRIDGFYLEPAAQLCKRGNAFAAGVLLVSCVDALSRYDPRVPPEKTTKNTERFTWWVKSSLPSFEHSTLALRFYQEFRCGLVHEARIKKGSAFTDANTGHTIWAHGEFLFVNPSRLLHELAGALDAFCNHLHHSASALGWFQVELAADFNADLAKFP